MSYNPNCYDNSCYQGCCTSTGYCPVWSSNECWYYYYDPYYTSYSSLTNAARIGLIVGLSIFGVILIAVIIGCIWRFKNRDNVNMQIARPNQQVIVIQNPTNANGGYPPYQYSNQDFNMSYNSQNGYPGGYQQNYPPQNYPNGQYNYQNYQQNGPISRPL